MLKKCKTFQLLICLWKVSVNEWCAPIIISCKGGRQDAHSEICPTGQKQRAADVQ